MTLVVAGSSFRMTGGGGGMDDSGMVLPDVVDASPPKIRCVPVVPITIPRIPAINSSMPLFLIWWNTLFQMEVDDGLILVFVFPFLLSISPVKGVDSSISNVLSILFGCTSSMIQSSVQQTSLDYVDDDSQPASNELKRCDRINDRLNTE
jgi:hypothetical protein